MPQQPVVWSEIPVRDMDKSIAFYAKVFGYQMTLDITRKPMSVLNGYQDDGGGLIYPVKDSQTNPGPTLHLTIPDKLEDAAARCIAEGGKVLGDPVTLPVGRFVYAEDPDGNSLGLFEAAQA